MIDLSRLSEPELRAFVTDNTRLQSPSHVPEMRLHLADEVTPIWRLTEEALGEMGLPPPFWAFAWAGGQGVARYLLDAPHWARGEAVLDFATGSGLVAIAAMLAGASSAKGVDIDRFCGPAVHLNARANQVAVDFLCENLPDRPPPSAGLITAGDVGYEKPLALGVMAWLKQAHDQGSKVLIGDPGRTYFSSAGLRKLAEYQVPTTRDLEDFEVKRTGVWTFA